MFMVASSVVTTIMILNYHHRQADTHEMPSWVSSSSSRALSRSKYTRSYSGFVIIPSAVCLYLSELFSSIKFWKWESDAKKRTRTYSMPLSSWKLKCTSRECGRYPPYLHTIQFWAKTLFLRLPSPGTTSDSAGKNLPIKIKINCIIWVCWKIQSLNFHIKSNAKIPFSTMFDCILPRFWSNIFFPSPNEGSAKTTLARIARQWEAPVTGSAAPSAAQSDASSWSFLINKQRDY